MVAIYCFVARHKLAREAGLNIIDANYLVVQAASDQKPSLDKEKRMNIDSDEARLLANALYEIRQLLSPYLGSKVDAPIEVRMAAHLAYALHNEALAIMEGSSFDVRAALRKVSAIDNILHVNEATRLVTTWAK